MFYAVGGTWNLLPLTVENECCDRRCFTWESVNSIYILVVCKTNGLLNLHCCTTETHPRVLQCNSCKWDTPGNLWDLFHWAQTLRKSIFIFLRFKKATVQCWFWGTFFCHLWWIRAHPRWICFPWWALNVIFIDFLFCKFI